jgi:hypothetical protein
MNSLSRLFWALPLVLVVGAAVMLVLRRFVLPVTLPRGATRIVARETLALSEHTRVHLVEIDGSSHLILESTQNAVLQSLSVQVGAQVQSPVRSRPAWLRRLSGATR